MSVSGEISLRFRRLSALDIADLLPIEQEAYDDPWSPGMFQQELDNQASHFFVVFAQDALVGYGGFWFVVDEVHITKVTVSAECRSRGYGREIMQYLLERGKELGAVYARLEVRELNEVARKLYASLGFREIGLRHGYYTKTNETAVVMTKRIAGA